MKSESETVAHEPTDRAGQKSVSEMSVNRIVEAIDRFIGEAGISINASRRAGKNDDAIYQQGCRDGLKHIRDWITSDAEPTQEQP